MHSYVSWNKFDTTMVNTLVPQENSWNFAICIFKWIYLNEICQCKWYSIANFINFFYITIQIWWKFCFDLALIQAKWSLQNFAHGMPQLSSHGKILLGSDCQNCEQKILLNLFNFFFLLMKFCPRLCTHKRCLIPWAMQFLSWEYRENWGCYGGTLLFYH